MKISSRPSCINGVLLLTLLTLALVTGGCSSLDLSFLKKTNSSDAMGPVPKNEPYYTSDFKDLLIPGELDWAQDNSMTIKTDSFQGGILNFTGRVEVTSLTNFFVTNMVKNKWKMTGSVKSNNVLLSFIKPWQTCMIRIIEGEFGLKTEVYIYITKDLSGGDKSAPRLAY